MKKLLLILLCLPFFGTCQCVEGDCENGYRVYVWDSGERYEGLWKNDKRHGQGTNYFANGDIFSGTYRYGKKHGLGWYHWNDGQLYLSIYKYGERDEILCETEY